LRRRFLHSGFCVLIAVYFSSIDSARAGDKSVSEACAGIVQRPIPFNEERTRLMVAYLKEHNGTPAVFEPDYKGEMQPKVVVLHWTATRTADTAYNTFAPTRLGGRKYLSDAGAVNVSAHYLVDQDGSVAQLMPDNQTGRHTIGLNHNSIGIENVGGLSGIPLTSAQVDANIQLVRCLTTRHEITHLIGHHEYRLMEGTALFVETDPEYRTVKVDPGDTFMLAVREKLKDFGLQGPPKAGESQIE
jgi:N-acetylmuramoyl-L-alanine amidase